MTTDTPETPSSTPPVEEAPAAPTPSASSATQRGYIMIAYALFAVGMMTGLAMMLGGRGGIFLDLFAAAGAFLVYRNRADFIGSIYESHATWLVRTFVLTLIGLGAGFVAFSFTISRDFGGLVLLVVGLYYIYRVFKGFRTFARARKIADPLAFV
ncbi:DUF4870 family protein [Pararhodospirillum photometricum]|nr:hypothetical protein [Pararhodospirillum photometricum]